MSLQTSSLTEFAHIVCTPGIMGGEPRIDGHRIRVRDIVAARDDAGHSPEEIAGSVYPILSLAEVYAALAYYEDHRNEIGKFANAEEATASQFSSENPEFVGVVQSKQV